jgi:hypothetical protein
MKDNYKDLKKVLDLALLQASEGKGKERHANNEPFTEQLIFIIEKLTNSFQLGQAIKKIVESQRLEREAGIRELLGAINYISAKVIERKNGKETLFEKHKIKKSEVEKFSVLTQLKDITEGKEK